jgi:hypothetical protein
MTGAFDRLANRIPTPTAASRAMAPTPPATMPSMASFGAVTPPRSVPAATRPMQAASPVDPFAATQGFEKTHPNALVGSRSQIFGPQPQITGPVDALGKTQQAKYPPQAVYDMYRNQRAALPFHSPEARWNRERNAPSVRVDPSAWGIKNKNVQELRALTPAEYGQIMSQNSGATGVKQRLLNTKYRNEMELAERARAAAAAPPPVRPDTSRLNAAKEKLQGQMRAQRLAREAQEGPDLFSLSQATAGPRSLSNAQAFDILRANKLASLRRRGQKKTAHYRFRAAA